MYAFIIEIKRLNKSREMLMNTLRILVYELFFRNILWENDKIINFSANFLYFS